MQTLFRAFLAIYLAHLLTDFVFQTHGLVEQKRRGKPFAYFLHGLTHYLAGIVLIGFFIPGSSVTLRTHLVIAGLALIHLLIDCAKVQLVAQRLLSDNAFAYLGDQLVHFLTVILAARLVLPGVSFHALPLAVQRLRSIGEPFLLVVVVYLLVIFVGGYLIRFLTRSLAESAKADGPKESEEQLQNAGLYVGWLERFLILTALLLQSPSAVGLILAVKAIARYPEFKSVRFAEYVLIGTLLSVSIAYVGALFLAWMLPSHVRPSG
jgi:uncharacterized protein DUF3307